MDGKEQVGFALVGKRGTTFQWNERIVGAGVDDLGVQSLFDQLANALGNVEHEVLFQQTFYAGGALVMAAVAGVDDDAADLEAERAGKRTAAGRRVTGGLAQFNGRSAGR